MIRKTHGLVAVLIASLLGLFSAVAYGASYYTGPAQGYIYNNTSNINVPSGCTIASYGYAASGTEMKTDYWGSIYYETTASNAQVRVFNQNTGTVQELSVYSSTTPYDYQSDMTSTSAPAGTYQVLHYGYGSTGTGGYAAMETHINW